MGLLQNIFRKILPTATFANMEAETRKWVVRCRACSAEQNLWDIGGIRSGSTGGKSATRLRCEPCGKNEWHTLHYTG